MSSFKNRIWEDHLLPFEVIEAVVRGEVNACRLVVKNFEKYIEQTCMVTVCDENGWEHREVDESMKKVVSHKLFHAIAGKFEMLPLE